MTVTLPADLADWLARSAEGIDRGDVPAASVLPRLAGAGLTRLAVPQAVIEMRWMSLKSNGSFVGSATRSLAMST